MKITIKKPDGTPIERSFDKPTVTIGRSTKADFCLSDESLSRLHCQIDFDGGDFHITDLGSSNGVFLDGTKIPSHQQVKFTTFMQLTLGAFECSVSDEDEAFTPVFPTPIKGGKTVRADEEVQIPTKPARAVSLKALNSSAGIEPAKTKSKSPATKKSASFLLSAAVFTGIVGYLFYSVLVGKEPEKTEAVATNTIIERNVPEKFRAIPNEFLSTSEYEKIAETANCKNEIDVCIEFKLSDSAGEGVILENNQYFVVVNSSKQPTEPTDQEFSDAKQLAATKVLKEIFMSKLFDRFLKKEYAQLHILVKENQTKLYRVFRFNVVNFASGGNEKIHLVNFLRKSYTAKDLSHFWTPTKALIHTKEF